MPMKHSQSSRRAGFTLIELLVVIAIIAVLAGLIFPVIGKVRLRGVETRTVSNLRQVAAAMGAYGGDHNGMLPGPLSQEQYPGFGASDKRDKGSLARLLSTYLGLTEKKSAEAATATGADVLVCPMANPPDGVKLDDIAGYIMNMEVLPDYEKPAWGDLKDDTQPMTRAALTAWKDKSSGADPDSTVKLSAKWAMRHTDKDDCKNLGISGDWVDKLPDKPVFEGSKIADHQYGRYQTLFFDMHVESYEPVGKDGKLKP